MALLKSHKDAYGSVGNVVVSTAPHPDYAYANSEATRMLAAALDKAKEDKGWSQRSVAKALGYKASVVVSHMALGRVAIPIDRAMDIARLFGMDASEFLLAVLEQRHPEIDFLRVLGSTAKTKGTGKGGRESFVLEELEALAGKPLDELSAEQARVMRELAANPNAGKRWLDLHELPMVALIRAHHPQGLTRQQRDKLDEALAAL